MQHNRIRNYYREFASAIRYVEVQNKSGDLEIGSRYHIGDGVFISARHVLDVHMIKTIATTVSWYVPSEDSVGQTAKSFAGKISDIPFKFPYNVGHIKQKKQHLLRLLSRPDFTISELF